MLFRLLLTVSLSLVGAWSLPALGCLKLPLMEDLIRSILPTMEDFDKAKQKSSGGGTWRDSKGRDGTFTSAISTLSEKVRDCGRGMKMRLGCYENAVFRLYVIKLDDGRSEWFKWHEHHFNGVVFSASGSGSLAMEFVRTADEDDSRTITIVDGDYTLTLVEEKIKRVPNSITYNPSSNLSPHRIIRKELEPLELEDIKF